MAKSREFLDTGGNPEDADWVAKYEMSALGAVSKSEFSDKLKTGHFIFD